LNVVSRSNCRYCCTSTVGVKGSFHSQMGYEHHKPRFINLDKNMRGCRGSRVIYSAAHGPPQQGNHGAVNTWLLLLVRLGFDCHVVAQKLKYADPKLPFHTSHPSAFKKIRCFVASRTGQQVRSVFRWSEI